MAEGIDGTGLFNAQTSEIRNTFYSATDQIAHTAAQWHAGGTAVITSATDPDLAVGAVYALNGSEATLTGDTLHETADNGKTFNADLNMNPNLA